MSGTVLRASHIFILFYHLKNSIRYTVYLHFTNGETEAQSNHMTHSKSLRVGEMKFESEKTSTRAGSHISLGLLCIGLPDKIQEPSKISSK